MTPSNISHIDPADWDLIDRYFAGELSETDAAVARRWLTANAIESAALESMERELDGGETLQIITDNDIRASWLRVRDKFHNGDDALPLRTPRKTGNAGVRPMRWNWIRRYSAVVVIASILVAFGGIFVARGSKTSTGVSGKTTTTYSTPPGQQSRIVLPDGSTVFLNVASRIDIPADFASGNRNVVLHGAAMFSVVPSPAAPFTVTTGGATARVLGTTFAVRHYDSDTAVTVAVRDGKVAVGLVVVSANRQAIIGKNGNILLTSAALEQFSFEKGVLTLQDVRLGDAVADLNRWYNADIRIADTALANNRIHVSLPAGSLTDLELVLEFMLNAVAERQGQVWTLYPR